MPNTAYNYPRISLATPEDPADLHLENQGLKLMLGEALALLLDRIPSLSEGERLQVTAMAGALLGYEEDVAC